MPDPLVLPRRRRMRGATPQGTWWGRAWLRSCEEVAAGPDELAGARALARSGRFGAVVVLAGMASAVLDPGGEGALVAQVKVATLTDDEWEVVVRTLAGRSGHLAALETGELPDELVAETDQHGVELLPGPEAITTACECAGWAQPCTHALALATLLAWAMADDPYVLLLLRGRTREALLDAAAAGDATRHAVEDAAVRARRILQLSDEAPPGHGLADSAVAAYDERIERLL